MRCQKTPTLKKRVSVLGGAFQAPRGHTRSSSLFLLIILVRQIPQRLLTLHGSG